MVVKGDFAFSPPLDLYQMNTSIDNLYGPYDLDFNETYDMILLCNQ